MKRKVELKLNLPMYILAWIIIALIGFVETAGSWTGFALGLVTAIVFSLATLIGLVPFAGVFLYMHTAGWFSSLLVGLGVSIPIATTLAFWGFFIFALIGCGVTSFIVGLLILKVLLGD